MTKIRVSPQAFEEIRLAILESAEESGALGPSQRLTEVINIDSNGNHCGSWTAWQFGDVFILCDPSKKS